MKKKTLVAIIIVALILLLIEAAFIINKNHENAAEPNEATQTENMNPMSLPSEDPDKYIGEEEALDDEDVVTFPQETSKTVDADSNELPEEDFD